MIDYAFGQKPQKPRSACCMCGRPDTSLADGQGQYYCGCQPNMGGERYLPRFRCTKCNLPFAIMAGVEVAERVIAENVTARGGTCDRCANA